MDLSLYKDEAQLDKTSPRKRRRGEKSEEEEESDDDEDYEEHPKKKKIAKRPAAIKSPKMSPGKKIPATVNDESTESDEENLMEIKKKAVKKQVNLVRGMFGNDVMRFFAPPPCVMLTTKETVAISRAVMWALTHPSPLKA